MGFIKAFTGSLSSAFADQWKDYLTPRVGLPASVGVSQAVPNGTNNGLGQNTKGSENIITNGSKIVVPEGMGLVTIQDGAITGFIAEPGGFIYTSDDPNSRSLFAGDGIFASTLGQTWERVKFGGVPATQQLAFYVNLKEITGSKFGTKEPVYWNDSYLEMKAAGMARGEYSLKISDPLLFIKNFVPQRFLQPGAENFDFADLDNEAGNKLFDEFTTCLSSSIAKLSIAAKEEAVDTMDYIQSNQAKFALTMNGEVENTYHWATDRGIEVLKVSITISYDEKTQEVLDEIRKDDQEIRRAKRMGQAYGDNMAGMMAAASSDALKSAASNENGAMMGLMGMNLASMQANNMMGTATQMQAQQTATEQPVAQPAQPAAAAPAEDPYAKLTEMKKLLDAGVITQADFDAAKNKLLGL